jgi:hypothetical protein
MRTPIAPARGAPSASNPDRTPALSIHRETVTCPYCWQSIEITIDLSAGDQTYVEDCSVCCRPIVVSFQTDGEALGALEVTGESEA